MKLQEGASERLTPSVLSKLFAFGCVRHNRGFGESYFPFSSGQPEEKEGKEDGFGESYFPFSPRLLPTPVTKSQPPTAV